MARKLVDQKDGIFGGLMLFRSKRRDQFVALENTLRAALEEKYRLLQTIEDQRKNLNQKARAKLASDDRSQKLKKKLLAELAAAKAALARERREAEENAQNPYPAGKPPQVTCPNKLPDNVYPLPSRQDRKEGGEA